MNIVPYMLFQLFSFTYLYMICQADEKTSYTVHAINISIKVPDVLVILVGMYKIPRCREFLNKKILGH